MFNCFVVLNFNQLFNNLQKWHKSQQFSIFTQLIDNIFIFLNDCNLCVLKIIKKVIWNTNKISNTIAWN